MEVTCTHSMLVRITKKKINNDRRRNKDVNREGGGAFMSNTNYQRIEKLVLSRIGW